MNLLANNRIPSLDGLRTISVALVFVSHFLPLTGYRDNWNLGMLGVKFFFVISGFLITGILLKEYEKNDSIDLTKFYFRRTLRIFPPYYFYLAVLYIFSRYNADVPSDGFLSALTYSSNYFTPNSWNLLHTWSLSVEEQFYLIFPFVLIFFGRKHIVWILAALVIFAPLIRLADFHLYGESAKMWIYYGFHANADGLATGCLMAIFYERLHKSRFYLRILNSRSFLVAPISLVLVNSIIDPRQFYLGVSFTVSNILIVLCVDWAITNYNKGFIGGVLNTRPMEQVGVMSYSIYMWQQPFLNNDTRLWFNAFPYNIIGIAAFSCISYYLVEKTSLRWRGAIENKIFGKRRRRKDDLTGLELTAG